MAKNLAEDELSYTLDKNYYYQPTHVFSTPAGWACPHADSCLTKADRETGKLVKRPDKNPDGTIPLHVSSAEPYVCYAARSERYPGVRNARWRNFEAARRRLAKGETFNVPDKATHVRVHGSGDFFNEKYFLNWMETARQHPDVLFWAFTKSFPYWVKHIDAVPENFSLTASVGSKHDELIGEYDLKTATVFYDINDVPEDMAIDYDDREAQDAKAPSFALLENLSNRNQADDEQIQEHNRRAYELQGRTWMA